MRSVTCYYEYQHSQRKGTDERHKLEEVTELDPWDSKVRSVTCYYEYQHSQRKGTDERHKLEEVTELDPRIAR